MHVLLWAEDSEAELRAELAEAFGTEPNAISSNGVIQLELPQALEAKLPHLVFARQFLPNVRAVQAESVRDWARLIFEQALALLPDGKPWSLHIAPHYGTGQTHRIGARAWHTARRLGSTSPGGNAQPAAGNPRPGENERRLPTAAVAPRDVPDASAGRNRCDLIGESLVEIMRKKRRHLLRQLHSSPEPFGKEDSLVQVLLSAPNRGWISMAPTPVPFVQRHVISTFPKGMIPIASDKDAPSRAFAKLMEAELRLGSQIKPGETCVDLGAAPGSWTYVAAMRGAHVVAVDRAELRADLMQHPNVRFQPGDAFKFKPAAPVDWLVCDVIADPERTAELLVEWLRRGWCDRFVVTFKLKDTDRMKVVAWLKAELPQYTQDLHLTRLCANKKEICAFGTRAPFSPG